MRRIAATDWLLALLGKLQRALTDLRGVPPAERQPPPEMRDPGPTAPAVYRPLQRLVLADEVARVLFDEYANHRATERGDEETGWALLGWRDADEAVALATLPAGADREAGEAHVRFNSSAQAVASRIVRQSDRRLALLGVVHTHPGSLRHPSDGDFRGDISWVGQLRGAEGVFGIGTADGKYARPADELWRPRPNMQCRGDLCFNWYSLRQGAQAYQSLPVEIARGPDLAAPLRGVWAIIEEHAQRLERLARQLTRVSFEVLVEPDRPALGLAVPLADGELSLRVVLTGKEVRYFLCREGSLLAADLSEPHADKGVFRLLAELAGGD
ncbi:MAG: Mov34/MPN/PAD-1 family protein [Gemmataceae bacterium]